MSFYNNVLEDKNKRKTENQFFSYGTCCSQILRASLSSPILHAVFFRFIFEIRNF